MLICSKNLVGGQSDVDGVPLPRIQFWFLVLFDYFRFLSMKRCTFKLEDTMQYHTCPHHWGSESLGSDFYFLLAVSFVLICISRSRQMACLMSLGSYCHISDTPLEIHTVSSRWEPNFQQPVGLCAQGSFLTGQGLPLTPTPTITCMVVIS